MIVSPTLGTGDLIILKMRSFEFKEEITQINIHLEILRTHRADPEKNLVFIKKLLNFLFPNVPLNMIETKYDSPDLNHIPLNKTYLYDDLNFSTVDKPNDPRLNSSYLIFHSKVRIDYNMDLFLQRDLPLLKTFLENFKTNLTIVIMGEREVESNFETRASNVQSIYPLLCELKRQNTVVDYSHDNLCSGNPDFDNFLSEVEIINKAVVNVTFGIGGPVTLCQAFSKTNLAYTCEYRYATLIRYASINHNLYTTMPPFLAELEKYAIKGE